MKGVDGDAFAMTLFDFGVEPFAWDLRPDFFTNEGSLFVADPTCLSRENENGIAGDRDQHVDVAMDNLEVGYVANGAFESGILIPAHDQGVDLFGFHRRADMFVTAVDFVLAGHLAADLRLMRSADFSSGESIHLRGVDECFDGDLFPFRIARAARGAVIQCFDSEAGHYGGVGVPENGGVFGRRSEYALVKGLYGFH